MPLPKISIGAGITVLVSLAAPPSASWTAILDPVGGSGITGTALIDVSDGPPGPGAADSLGQFDSLPPFQSDSERTVNPGPMPVRGGPLPTHATISINGARAGEYRWQIGSGRCGQTRIAAGDGAPYPTIRVYTNGKGSAEATVGFTLTPGAEYSVVVLRSRTDNAVVACGLLESGGGVTP